MGHALGPTSNLLFVLSRSGAPEDHTGKTLWREFMLSDQVEEAPFLFIDPTFIFGQDKPGRSLVAIQGRIELGERPRVPDLSDRKSAPQ